MFYKCSESPDMVEKNTPLNSPSWLFDTKSNNFLSILPIQMYAHGSVYQTSRLSKFPDSHNYN